MLQLGVMTLIHVKICTLRFWKKSTMHIHFPRSNESFIVVGNIWLAYPVPLILRMIHNQKSHKPVLDQESPSPSKSSNYKPNVLPRASNGLIRFTMTTCSKIQILIIHMNDIQSHHYLDHKHSHFSLFN